VSLTITAALLVLPSGAPSAGLLEESASCAVAGSSALLESWSSIFVTFAAAFLTEAPWVTPSAIAPLFALLSSPPLVRAAEPEATTGRSLATLVIAGTAVWLGSGLVTGACAELATLPEFWSASLFPMRLT
jgi:hypothetical protein